MDFSSEFSYKVDGNIIKINLVVTVRTLESLNELVWEIINIRGSKFLSEKYSD